MHSSIFAAVAVLAGTTVAQSPAWGQCGGINFSGPTTCVSGYSCTKQNDFYSQCLPGTATSISTKVSSTSTKASSTSTKASSTSTKVSSTSTKVSSTLTTSTTSKASSTPTSPPNPWWFGVNLSGAEFGEKNFSGVYGKEYIWYEKSSIDTLIGKGMNHFRINFLMERLTPNSLTGAFDKAYLGNLTEQVNYITSKGATAMIQPHNYGRFYGNIITDVTAFGTWWKNVAAQYKDKDNVVFDINNEFWGMDQDLVKNLNQAGIDGIRAAGATKQWITPEGNAWTGAWTWVSSGNAASLVSLTDPSNKLIYQMHQYLDSDGSGTSDACVSSTIFKERLEAATNWLRQNKKLGLIGEYAGGSNAQCIQALQGGLSYLKANNDVWTGTLWWAAGPWWGTYIYNMEPTTGVAYTSILPQIASYAK